MIARVAIHVAIVHRAIHHVAVHDHVAVARAHVDVRDLNERPRAGTPSTAGTHVHVVPAVVVHGSTAPVEVVVQPPADRKAHTERPVAAGEPDVEDRPGVYEHRIVHRHIDHAWLRRHNHVVVRLAHHLLLRRRDEIALRIGQAAHALHRGHDVAGLIGISATECRRPVTLVGHHVERRLVMRHRFYAHIPRLLVDAVRAVLAHPTRRVFHLIGKRGRHQHLRQQRIRIQRNRTNQIVELILGEALHIEHLVSRRPDDLCRKRRERGNSDQRQRQQWNERDTGHGAAPTGDTGKPLTGHMVHDAYLSGAASKSVISHRLGVCGWPRDGVPYPRFRTVHSPKVDNLRPSPPTR